MFTPTGRRLALFLVGVAAIVMGAGWYFTSREADPKALVERAEVELQAGRFDDAWACVRRLERIRPPTAPDRLLRARIASGMGDDTAALKELQFINEESKVGAQALFMIGLVERRRNRLRLAEDAYRKALQLEPELIQARRELIYILGMQSRRRELDAEFKALAELVPLTRYDLYIWGLTHFVTWGSDSANELAAFIEADPEDRKSRVAMAALLLSQPGQEARVEELLKPLPRDDPEVLALLIEQEISRGRVDEATSMIARTNSDDPHLARLRGQIALRQGDRAAAVRYFRQALSDAPYDRISNAELGKALMLQGDRAAAETYMARARHLDEVYNLVTTIGKPRQTGEIADLNRLGGACESAGLLDEARGWYMLVIDQNALDPEAQQGLKRIRSALPTAPTSSRPG
jgi:tetratricopeptide (TPR) repeat protein